MKSKTAQVLPVAPVDFVSCSLGAFPLALQILLKMASKIKPWPVTQTKWATPLNSQFFLFAQLCASLSLTVFLEPSIMLCLRIVNTVQSVLCSFLPSPPDGQLTFFIFFLLSLGLPPMANMRYLYQSFESRWSPGGEILLRLQLSRALWLSR